MNRRCATGAFEVILDTGPLVYYIHNRTSWFSRAAEREIDRNAAMLCVSAASLYEITLKAQLGSWKEVTRYAAGGIEEAIEKAGVIVYPINSQIAERAGLYGLDHRDPFDRMIAATCDCYNMNLLSEDMTIGSLSGTWQRIW